MREPAGRIDAIGEWRSRLTSATSSLLAFELVTGLAIYLLPFSEFNQFGVILHTVLGFAMIAPVAWYSVRHWWVRRKGNLSHHQLLGYVAVAALFVCIVTGVVLTWQGVVGPRISRVWSLVHLITGVAVGFFIVVHVATVIVRKLGQSEAAGRLRAARRALYVRTTVGAGALTALCGAWAALYAPPSPYGSFVPSYNWRFGDDRPFAPSLARLERTAWSDRTVASARAAIGADLAALFDAALASTQRDPAGLFDRIRRAASEVGADGAAMERVEAALVRASEHVRTAGAVSPAALARSDSCGTSGCHSEILEEWLPSAHRYASLDDMFQRVQTLMVAETSPEHTRYCAGCHDPISLLSGAKNASNITLSAEGSHEGVSCLVCHSIVQADVQGNGDYTIEPQQRYAYELSDGPAAKFVSDFLIRAYPRHHVESYARPLYKTPEFCAACHKQYIDTEVNTDIGKVQGQNQYDSWKNSRWHNENDPESSIECRECHMPLVAGNDPARGDATDFYRTPTDGKHRSHRTLASNQYIPTLHDLPGADHHVALTEAWLRGEIPIPEIADRWVDGPVVRLGVLAPERVAPETGFSIQVTMTNNKTGHDFPTGPLDMIESWIELRVTGPTGEILHHSGAVNESGSVVRPEVVYKADGFDREGALIDRHNLWDLVGASYKRALYPGATDTVHAELVCPSMARGRVSNADRGTVPGQRVDSFELEAPDTRGEIHVEATLWYRKANPEFLDRVYGVEAGVRSPATAMSSASATIQIEADVDAALQ